MINKLNQVKEALLTVTKEVYHYEAYKRSDEYIVWAEESEVRAIYYNNKKEQQVIQGTIDYFTKKEGDTTVDAIQEALTAYGISFYLNSVQYEDETQYIHYEWIFEVI